MSIEIVLIPLAIAAVSAWQAKRAEQDLGGSVAVQVGTRMRDAELLGHALGDVGAAVEHREGELDATWEKGRVTFRRDPDGIWSAQFGDGVDLEQATEFVGAVDVAYGKRVQGAVLARIRDRADAAGLRLESETVEEDRSVTMVLNVVRGEA